MRQRNRKVTHDAIIFARIPYDLHENIGHWAAALDISNSELVRRACETYVAALRVRAEAGQAIRKGYAWD